MILEGKRCVLEPLRASHVKDVEAWLHDPEANQWMLLARTAPSAQQWVADLANAWPRHAVRAIRRRGGGPIGGIVGLFDIDFLQRRAELRIVIGNPMDRGAGIGTEAVRLMVEYAFRSLDLFRVWLGTAAENHRARACFERVGFQYEGTSRLEFLRADGQRADNVRYAILRPDWEVLQ